MDTGTSPVLAVWTLERFLRLVDSQVALQMRLARELLLAQIAAIEHVRRHVYHLDVHLQDVWVLEQKCAHDV